MANQELPNALTMTADEFKQHLSDWLRTTPPGEARLPESDQVDCLQMTREEFKRHCQESGANRY